MCGTAGRALYDMSTTVRQATHVKVPAERHRTRRQGPHIWLGM